MIPSPFKWGKIVTIINYFPPAPDIAREFSEAQALIKRSSENAVLRRQIGRCLNVLAYTAIVNIVIGIAVPMFGAFLMHNFGFATTLFFVQLTAVGGHLNHKIADENESECFDLVLKDGLGKKVQAKAIGVEHLSIEVNRDEQVDKPVLRQVGSQIQAILNGHRAYWKTANAPFTSPLALPVEKFLEVLNRELEISGPLVERAGAIEELKKHFLDIQGYPPAGIVNFSFPSEFGFPDCGPPVRTPLQKVLKVHHEVCRDEIVAIAESALFMFGVDKI